MEVVEHILHYVSDLGLHYTFPDEWGISKTSALAQAMNKAVDEGYYDVTSYEDIDDEEVRHRVMMQEFAYWVISTAWNLQEPYGPIGEDLSKKKMYGSPNSNPSPELGADKENHTSWERYYQVSDCSSSLRNDWYSGI